MFTEGQKRRIRFSAGVILCGFLLVGVGHSWALRALGAVLIVEDRVEPAAAIVALGGGPPFREMEAAKLYRDGWAPRIILVRGACREDSKALQKLGIPITETWQISREVLLRLGVPPSSIVVPEDEAAGTLEELQAAYRAIGSLDAPVILVTSKYHTRRTRLTWNYVSDGRSRGIVRAASQDPFDPAHWWRERRFVLSVIREYLGLVNYYVGFPVGTGSS